MFGKKGKNKKDDVFNRMRKSKESKEKKNEEKLYWWDLKTSEAIKDLQKQKRELEAKKKVHAQIQQLRDNDSAENIAKNSSFGKNPWYVYEEASTHEDLMRSVHNMFVGKPDEIQKDKKLEALNKQYIERFKYLFAVDNVELSYIDTDTKSVQLECYRFTMGCKISKFPGLCAAGVINGFSYTACKRDQEAIRLMLDYIWQCVKRIRQIAIETDRRTTTPNAYTALYLSDVFNTSVCKAAREAGFSKENDMRNLKTKNRVNVFVKNFE